VVAHKSHALTLGCSGNWGFKTRVEGRITTANSTKGRWELNPFRGRYGVGDRNNPGSIFEKIHLRFAAKLRRFEAANRVDHVAAQAL
jgi:hypothetical protein